MDVCKCIVISWYGEYNEPYCFVRLVEEEERSLTTSRVFSLKIVVEPNKIVLSLAWCSKLRLTTGVHSALCHNEFCGPRSDTIRHVEFATTAANDSIEVTYFKKLFEGVFINVALFSITRAIRHERHRLQPCSSDQEDTRAEFMSSSRIATEDSPYRGDDTRSICRASVGLV
ncbi:hypothetical protein TNCV_2340401 [Trichonephila clavipes]|nr:hypothetical protein TNCV_2340401 [Trichonephila clavipes]